MKKRISIQTKVFSWIISLILLFLLLSFIFTAFLFKPYYIHRHKNLMLETSRNIASLYITNSTGMESGIERAERMQGYVIEIFSSTGSVIYPSDQKGIQQHPRMIPEHFPPPQLKAVKGFLPPTAPRDIRDLKSALTANQYIYNKHYDEMMKTWILHIYYMMEDGGIVHLNHPLEPIEQSIIISTQFTFFTGIIDLFFGILAAFFIARFFTNPIRKLTGIAEDMARLDFSQKYENESNDEIGDLGRSINSLSYQLYHSMSELNKLNNSLQDEIERKRRIDEMRKEFIANVSHELRTPLSLIKGYAEGLQDDVNHDRGSKDFYCEVIRDETQKMEKHVSSLLALSQIQSRAIPLELEEFDITRLISDIGEKYKNKIRENRINLIFHHAGTILVSADRDKTEQVIVNYLNNAINHSEGKRDIAVTLIRTGSHKIRLKVSNCGRNIPEDCLEKIWDSYYKIDKARTRQYGGTGLGLSIVRAIQEQYGNDYGAENYGGGCHLLV